MTKYKRIAIEQTPLPLRTPETTGPMILAPPGLKSVACAAAPGNRSPQSGVGGKCENLFRDRPGDRVRTPEVRSSPGEKLELELISRKPFIDNHHLLSARGQ